MFFLNFSDIDLIHSRSGMYVDTNLLNLYTSLEQDIPVICRIP